MSDRPGDIDEIRRLCEMRHPHTPDETIAWLAVHRLLREPPLPAADLARWLQEWAEKQPAITIRRGVEPQVAWRALADELLRRWGR